MADFAGCVICPLFACWCMLGTLGIPSLAGVTYFISHGILNKIKSEEASLFSTIITVVLVVVFIAVFVLSTWWLGSHP
ncbi:hypothetical protein ANRL3_00769 [Anaerolineae bacterium]|nr:hypothetical protein ANRL3_00769 [Anaerolineae bacterium]